ncbi:fog: ankyrin repeat [Chrysochromulina tobinii]|uniref:Fog: ankyrin repeat n=1 Tax=Chrysochromulina tobinii TaxID=1460289 RepID=A0A0M0J343_9EUKA|nr:fog: ankyrin repeat [Chrysochromulina tobinii]|eukprot:KOO20959.1 fog: ankyrin repeat [Chrysochromulina sp. CCMP291]
MGISTLTAGAIGSGGVLETLQHYGFIDAPMLAHEVTQIDLEYPDEEEEDAADPSQACFGGATPLYMASSRNHAEVVRLLVRAGAPVDALANGYYTPLLAAVSHGCDEAARTLLAEGADVHVRSDKWGTYVHAAAKSGKVDMLKILIAFDADLEALFDGLAAQALAERRGHTEAANLLRKAIERRAQRVAAQELARDAAHAVCDNSTPEALAAAYAEAVERRDAERSSNALNAAASELEGASALTPEEAEAARLAAEKKAQKQEVVAAAQKDEKRSKLRALVGAAMRRDATTQALAIRARLEGGEDAEEAEETPSVAPAEDSEPQRAGGCVDVS